MFMNPIRFLAVAVLTGLGATTAFALDEPLFHFPDPLAARDEWGLLTQGPLNPTDFERREAWRLFYYSQSGKTLSSDPAYVGALQVGLRRKGYYTGPIDGVFSDEVSAAICRLQKAHAMRVNGRLTVSVRRVLFLP
ncbi:MAG: putative peptidoglycan binding domain [Verrucomicrobiota bacterium]